MRITDVAVHRVNIPLDTPYRWAGGRFPGSSKGIVEVRTDEGLTGLGELAEVGLSSLAEEAHAPRLIGADPLNIDECYRRCVPETLALSNVLGNDMLRAFGGIEIALWDLKGKALGVPLYELLGGAARKTVAFSEYFALRELTDGVGGELTPVALGEYCARMRAEHGSTVFEGKIGVGDLDDQIAVAREIRAAIGDDATLRLDVNMSWTLPVARKALRLLEPLDIANIEEPVASYRDMAKLRQHSAIPFSSHLTDLRLAVELGVPDTFVLNLTNIGGIRETIKFINACETFGVGFWLYSGDAGIATAGYLHLSAALPYLTQPHQSLLRWYTDDVIAEGPFRPKNDVLQVPDGPGLGVTLDPAALERCKRRFAEQGPLSVFTACESGYSRFDRQ